MFTSRIKKAISFLIVIAIALSLMSALPGYIMAETSADNPWDLSNFVQDVTGFDMSGDTPTQIYPGYDNLYVGDTYRFLINFAGTSQLEYNPEGRLEYRLPTGLYIQDAIAETSIYYPDDIGWFEIDYTGLITVWFDDVALQTLDDVSFTLEIFAQLTEDAGDSLDFGNGVVVETMPFGIIATLASGYSSDLADFITSVLMYDISQDPEVEIGSGDTTYIGNKYRFVITFAETPELQLAYNSNDMLTFQLPAGLSIQTAVAATAIQIANGATVGWYTISATGLVEVWFEDVDQYGVPTTDGSNYIDLTDVTITLEIFAQLTADAGGGLDFGNNIVVEFEPPIPPPPSLTVLKTSRYDPNTERIYYMITITALGAPVRNIWLSDTLTINGQPILNTPNNAFYGFRFALNGGTNFTPMDVNWVTPNYAYFTYNFGDLVLNPGNFITVYYYLDLPLLIANNPTLVPSLLEYNFNVSNTVSVIGDGTDGVNDSTTDNVRKDFPISKSGTVVYPSPPDEPYYQIRWTITIGNGETTRLNGGTVTDTLGADLFLPTEDQIAITFYGNPSSNIIFDGTAADLGDFTINSTNNGFTFSVPDTPGDDIYQVVIIFYTQINAPPHAGQPGIVYENNVDFNDGTTDFGTGGRVPFTPPTSGIISKTTSGICGNPDDGYWVDYTITVDVPGGIMAQQLYLFDNLLVGRGGTRVPNIPYWNGNPGVNITAAFTDGTPLPTLNPLLFFLDTTTGNYNEWRIYFGTDQAGGYVSWQYSQPVTLTVAYRIYLDNTTVDIMRNDNTAQLTNAVYLINSDPSLPIIFSGPGANTVAGVNANDSWPIFKTAQATDNPGLFTYTVTLKGNYSSRPTPFLQEGKSPTFTDTFDARLGYVPGSFYIMDTGNPQRFFAPAPGTDVNIVGSSISVNLIDLQEFNGPPALGGEVIDDEPGYWFAFKRNFEVHYQLYILEPGTAIQGLTNTALISVNPGECIFTNGNTVNYNPNPLSKTMEADGSEFVHVEIVINPDGSYIFSPDGGTTGPAEITARDVLTNLILYMDTVEFYTQTFIPIGASGVWDGVWTPQPLSYNDSALWSVNVVSQDIVDFVLPNETPIMIAYDALVTIPVGSTGDIKNEISIFGTSDDSGEDQYYVSGSQAGAGASQLDLRVFKRDGVGNNLYGAVFNLYVTVLPGYTAPTGLTGVLPVTVADGTTRNFYLLADNVMTDENGIAWFSDHWINATYQLLFLLVEVDAPYGYTAINDHTFFTINPHISPATILQHETILGEPINQISDFINITNIPDHLDPGTLRVLKQINGLTDSEISQYLQDFQIVITDPLGVENVFGLNEALAGIVLRDIMPGIYFITERNADIANFILETSPQLPIRRFIVPNDAGEVLIVIDNTYTPTIPRPPRPPIYPPIAPPVPPIYPTEPTEPTYPTHPTYPTEPTDPTAPTEPTYPPEHTDPTDPPVTPTAPPPSPQTGDSHQPAVLVALLIAGILFMGGAVAYLIRTKILDKRD